MDSSDVIRIVKRRISRFPRLHETLLTAKYRIRPMVVGSVGIGDSRQSVFSNIYDNNGWGNLESRSGSGSTADYTARLREKLPLLLRSLDARTIIDVPCGDFGWMRDVELPEGVSYIGADIVPALVETLRQTYTTPMRHFLQLDVVTDSLPTADLWLCRDCLIHLPNEAVFRVLDNFARSPIRFLLTTTFVWPPNADIPTGQFRPINLGRAPFSLPKPLQTVIDYVPPWPPRRLALYSNGQINQWAAQRRLSAA